MYRHLVKNVSGHATVKWVHLHGEDLTGKGFEAHLLLEDVGAVEHWLDAQARQPENTPMGRVATALERIAAMFERMEAADKGEDTPAAVGPIEAIVKEFREGGLIR